MSVIRIGGFQGEMPRIHPRLLPEGAAQTALNTRLDSGAVEPIKDTTKLQNTTLLEDPISLYRYATNIWLESYYDVDWVPYPVANDIYGRLIYADPTVNELRVTDASLVGTGGAPGGYYRLDVPAPTQGFSVTLQGTADDTDEVPETRYYVCTFVNSWGAEGPPSPASNQVEWRTGQTVLIEGLPAVPAGSYNITHRRIYRINTGSTGTTNYQYVTEVAVAQAQKSISAITQANPVQVTTTASHSFSDGQEVKFTGLGLEGTSVNVSNILKTNPVQVQTLTPHGLTTNDYVEMGGLGSGNGMDELDGTRGQITLIDSNAFSINGVDATAYTAHVTGGTVTQVYGMDELDDNSYVVSVVDATNFTLVSVDGTAYKAYLDGGQVAQVAGTTYTDTIASANLGEVLPSDIYDPPNDATIGIKTHPSGFLVGFFGNTVCFSEVGAPHAWPIDYRLVTSHDIVGLGVFGNTVAILTKGWPYLAVGSDPSAMSMIELEIEQACVAKRSIVDFGSAIAYASPDGLIVLSGNGATNASSAIFTRDQWQLLNPSSFEAYNWEQKYLCFYDSNRGFIIDPFDPAAGVRYVAKLATGGYKDIEEDLLYLIINNEIHKWDQGANLQYTWKSKPVHTPHSVNMSAAKITADDYPVGAEFYVDDVKRYNRQVYDNKAFRLPGGFKGEKFEVRLKSKKRVSQVSMATTMRELSVTV